MSQKQAIRALCMGVGVALNVACATFPSASIAKPTAKANAEHQASALTITTWNAEHLAAPATDGCRPRTQEELSQLKAYARSLETDIVALQEVASQQAIEQIFPADQWQVIVSDRPDNEPYECRGSGADSTQQKVAFAVRKGIEVTKVDSLEAFGLSMRGLRYALELTVDSAFGPLTLLNLHMKSGCFVDNYTRADTDSCQTFAKQATMLDQWVEQKEQQGNSYVVLGDLNHRLSAPYNHLTRQLMTNGEQGEASLENPAAHMVGCHPFYPAPIDHILVGNLKDPTIDKTPKWHPFDNMDPKAMLSDHCALSLTLTKAPLPLSNSVKWQTTSKEYGYLTTAIYQQASDALKQKTLPDSSWVVVMDVDETVLDNSQYQVNIEKVGQSYHPDTWDAWVKSEKATLVPGVKGFIETVFARGGKLALVTNRNRQLDNHTWANLLALDIPVSTDNTCLMGRVDEDKSAIGQAGIINDKDLRRQQIRTASASCYVPEGERQNLFGNQVILMQVGDNIEDFAKVTQHDANIDALVPKSKDELILLPNPMYGSW